LFSKSNPLNFTFLEKITIEKRELQCAYDELSKMLQNTKAERDDLSNNKEELSNEMERIKQERDAMKVRLSNTEGTPDAFRRFLPGVLKTPSDADMSKRVNDAKEEINEKREVKRYKAERDKALEELEKLKGRCKELQEGLIEKLGAELTAGTVVSNEEELKKENQRLKQELEKAEANTAATNNVNNGAEVILGDEANKNKIRRLEKKLGKLKIERNELKQLIIEKEEKELAEERKKIAGAMAETSEEHTLLSNTTNKSNEIHFGPWELGTLSKVWDMKSGSVKMWWVGLVVVAILLLLRLILL